MSLSRNFHYLGSSGSEMYAIARYWLKGTVVSGDVPECAYIQLNDLSRTTADSDQ
jgi:hypothetical protein